MDIPLHYTKMFEMILKCLNEETNGNYRLEISNDFYNETYSKIIDPRKCKAIAMDENAKEFEGIYDNKESIINLVKEKYDKHAYIYDNIIKSRNGLKMNVLNLLNF